MTKIKDEIQVEKQDTWKIEKGVKGMTSQNIIRETGLIPIAVSIAIMVAIATIGQQTVRAQQQNEVNWEQLCISYGVLVGIHTPCSELAHGSILTQKGKSALGCLFGGGTLILLGVDPTTVSMIGKAAREVCP
jgi:hypothetical protein